MTVLLNRMAQGDPAAADALMPQLYAQLHDLAEGMMKRQGSEHTLQPTALVHEAWMRLTGGAYADREHFAAVQLRRMVGSAKAASTAKPGRASISARSWPPMTIFAPMPMATSASGSETWRLFHW